MSWAWEELRTVGLPDPRLDLWLARIVEGFVKHPEASCPEAPCTAVLEEYEWKALCATVHARPRQLRMKPPTLREAVRMIAQLGGFLGRKCDGEPGPKTLWRGLRRLHDIAQGWLAAQKTMQRMLACGPPSPKGEGTFEIGSKQSVFFPGQETQEVWNRRGSHLAAFRSHRVQAVVSSAARRAKAVGMDDLGE